MNIKEQLEKDLGNLVSASSIDGCDYQCNAAFQIAKQEKTSPLQIAERIASNFKSKIATATVSPPGFVNFAITDSTLETTANNILKTGKLPLAKQTHRTIFFDYGGANVAKELHIGHLRPPIIGEALKRTFMAFGHKTVSDTFLGDWGLQMGLVLAQLMDEGYIKGDKFVKEVTLDTFNVLYPAASARSKTEPDFRARCEEITVKLQRKEQPYFDLWKHIRKISADKIQQNYLTLGCTFDTYNGESHAQPYIEQVLALARKNGAYESDGCLILDVKTDTDTGPMPPIMLKKSNEGDLYATTDLATVFYRYNDHQPDEFIYVADARQELHFEQVFRAAKQIRAVSPNTKFKHASCGTMNGLDGKPFKTRAGGIIKLEDIINLVTEAAMKRLTRGAHDQAQKIGLAALKFADLSNNVRKDYVFDVDKFTAFEGKTGPYLLYTVARINSILKKTSAANATKGELTVTDKNRKIIMSIIKLADSYNLATQNYTLNGIIDATYEVAAAFNLFYSQEKIADNENHLALARLVRMSLLFALDTLAIQPVDEM